MQKLGVFGNPLHHRHEPVQTPLTGSRFEDRNQARSRRDVTHTEMKMKATFRPALRLLYPNLRFYSVGPLVQ